MGGDFRKLKAIFALVVIIIAGSLYIVAYMGSTDKRYYAGLVIILLFIVPAVKLYERIKLLKELGELKSNWGKTNNRKRDMNEISRVFNMMRKCEGSSHSLSNQTWNDLNMDDIYKLLDRTITNPGEHALYNILRTPKYEDSTLEERNKIINFLQRDEKFRDDLQLILLGLGRVRNSSTADIIFGDRPNKIKYKFLFNILSLVSLASVLSFFYLGPKGLIFIVFPVYALNSFIHFKMKSITEGMVSSIKYLDRLVRAAYALGHKYESELLSYGKDLKESSDRCQGLLKKTGKLLFEPTNELAEYGNIFFFVEERSYFNVIHIIGNYIEELRKIYRNVGEVDALLSTASYREEIKSYAEPELDNCGIYLEVFDIRHPLLTDPVPNSIILNGRGAIITGSNMSGKSTFLRTLGVNCIFAQTICTCLASKYKGSYFNILTSISQSDNILSGKSYYLAEAEALLDIVKSSGSDTPLLCIIDEIFRGTNSLERISASVEILNYLARNNSIPIIATHDLEITSMIDEKYSLFYFSEDINEEGLHFDYHIKKGVSPKRNAVKLMKYLGYPSEIIDKTTIRVKSKLLEEQPQ